MGDITAESLRPCVKHSVLVNLDPDPAGAQSRPGIARHRAPVQVIYDRALFDGLDTPHKSFEPICSYDRYKSLLHAADIALLPLEPTRFNRHKSDLKFIECASQGAVALASPTVYERTIRHGETGIIRSRNSRPYWNA